MRDSSSTALSFNSIATALYIEVCNNNDLLKQTYYYTVAITLHTGMLYIDYQCSNHSM